MDKDNKDHPDGVFPFFIADTFASKVGLRTGKDFDDSVFRKSFKTNEILDEIAKYGSMCPFEPCKSHLESCGLESVDVVVSDVTSKDKKNCYLLLYTKKSIENFHSLGNQVEISGRSERSETSQPDSSNDTTMYTYKPFISRTYTSATTFETQKEIAQMKLSTFSQDRPLLQTILRRKNFDHIEKDNSLNYKDKNHLLARIAGREREKLQNVSFLLRDFWCQAPINASVEQSTQTQWSYKENKSIQYEPITLADFESNHEDILTDVCTFFREVLPRFEDALEQNETVDIYEDYFDMGTKIDLLPSNFVPDNEDSMKERTNFTDLDFSKGRYISSIDAHPNEDIIAVSLCEPGPQDDNGSSNSSFIILWDLNHQMQPCIVLKASFDCPVFRFNPTLPTIIVGGGVGGQIAMWNTENIPIYTSKRAECREQEPIILEPIVTSVPDHSHKQMVADITWLPPHIQLNAKGFILSSEHISETSNQFYTISGDGSILFWDVRYKDILMGKLPHIAKVKGDKKSLQGQNKWTPLYRIKPKRLVGTGELSFCKTFIPSSKNLDAASNCHSSTVIVCASEEGEILLVDWSPSPNESSKKREKEYEAFAAPDEFVQWIMKDHHRPCVALSQNCKFPDFVLSASDWNFRIWQMKSNFASLVFTSPNASCQITDGVWSPTRPSVLFIAKSNGFVDVWDFTDSCYAPCHSFSLIPSRINSIQIIEKGNGDLQYLAVGDNIGTLHVFDIPCNLIKPFAREDDCVMNLASASNITQLVKETANSATHEKVEGIDNNNTNKNPNQNEGLSEEEEILFMKLQSEFLQ